MAPLANNRNRNNNVRTKRNMNLNSTNMGRKFQNNLRTAMDGRAITPRADPPSIVQLPWNTVTLTFNATFAEASRTVTLTATDIILALIAVYPSEATNPYQIQIKSSRIWETEGHPISCVFHSLDVSNPGFLKNQDDTPARNQWARVGYIWPRSHQNQILTRTTTPVLTVSSSVGGAVVVLHVDILWKPTVSLLPPDALSAFQFNQPLGLAQETD
jgi:hypothetical protein